MKAPVVVPRELTEEQAFAVECLLAGTCHSWLTARGSQNEALLKSWAEAGWFVSDDATGRWITYTVTDRGLASLRYHFGAPPSLSS